MPEPPEPPMTRPALMTWKLMPPLSACAADTKAVPATATNAIRLARRADKVRMGVAPEDGYFLRPTKIGESLAGRLSTTRLVLIAMRQTRQLMDSPSSAGFVSSMKLLKGHTGAN